MNRDSVNSSHIKSIGYDVKRKVLEIQFKNGATYEYQDVPVWVRADMISSDSIGKYFHENIKGKYDELLVDG
jgi:hypothetical protein